MNYMFLPFRRSFDFQGRSRRLEFWLFLLFNVVVQTVLGIIAAALFGAKLVDLIRRYGATQNTYASGSAYDFSYSYNLDIPPEVLARELGTPFMVVLAIYGIYSMIVFFPYLAVTVRRLHDTNRSGWWMLVPALIYILCALLVFLAIAAPDMAILFATLGGVLGLAAMVAGLALLVFMFLDGTPGYNQFGPDPKMRDIRPTFA